MIESKYLLCERVACYQEKFKELKDIDSLIEMQSVIDDKINKVLAASPNMASCSYNGVELFTLRDFCII